MADILIRVKRPEGYEDVHPELVLQDMNINPAFEVEIVPDDTEIYRRISANYWASPSPSVSDGGEKGACRKCSGAMVRSKAIPTATSAGEEGTISEAAHVGSAPLVDCMKCSACGWSVTLGVMGMEPWSIEVHCSKGERTLRAGMQWRDGLYGGTWEVVEPKGGRIYSPSGFGGTPTFWCKPVGELPEGAKRWLEQARDDGCVSFCGDSIAAGLIAPCGVKGLDDAQA